MICNRKCSLIKHRLNPDNFQIEDTPIIKKKLTKYVYIVHSYNIKPTTLYRFNLYTKNIY